MTTNNRNETVIEVDDIALAKAFIAVQACADKKAEGLRVLDLRDLSSFADFFLVCTGFSDRQVQAIADAVILQLHEDDFKPISVEGYKEGRWIIVDYGDLVVHVFQDALRDYYDIESLWYDAKRIPIPQELFIRNIQH